MRSAEAAAKAEQAAKPAFLLLPERFYEYSPMDYVSVPTAGGTFVYVGVKDRVDFDKIAAPASSIEQAGRHLLTKTVGDFKSGVTVIFQHSLRSLTAAGHLLEARLKERDALLAQSNNAQARARIEAIETDIRAAGAGELIDSASPEVAS